MSYRVLVGIIVVLGALLVLALVTSAGLSGDSFASLIYATILATLTGSFALAHLRGNMPEAIRNLFIWALVAVILVIAYQYRAEFGFVT